MNDNLDKATHVRLKYTNIQDIIPQYYVPEPKRKKGKMFLQGNQMNSRSKISLYPKENEYEDLEAMQERRFLKKKSKNISSKYSKCSVALQNKYATISKVLQFLFCQIDVGRKGQYTKDGVYRTWQATQILKHTQDTNLGDFMIKLPNPNCMPSHLDPQKDERQRKDIQISEVSIIYDAMFNTEEIVDKVLANYEQQAFQLAFYLLDIRGTMPKSQINKCENQINKFLTQFKYYITITQLDIVKYIELRKSEKFQDNQKKIMDQFYIEQIKTIRHALDAGKSLEQLNMVFQNYKRNIFQRLNKLLLNCKDDRHQQYLTFNKIVCLFLKAPSISSIFYYFPDFLDDFMVQVKASKGLQRKYCNGGSLTKVLVQSQLKWTLEEQRPLDTLSLIRRMIMYKLTQRGGLFVRSFLSENQNYIFLVIKSTEKHLESMAQKKNFSMQLQFGAIDLFAFEPIDSYKRPLRSNKYIRDPAFRRKYDLDHNKQDKDQNCGQRSIESEAVTLYVRAQEMNQEELRAKVILDQEECDSMYKWISKTLSINFVKDDEVVINQYNVDQVKPQVWPAYFIYNKLIIEGIYRLKKAFESKQNNNQILQNLRKNIGLILRLMFLKAQYVCNDIYEKHRKSFARSIKNQVIDTRILKNVWNNLKEDYPRGYWPYFYSQKLDKMWRKYQINENKDRSKFTSSTRILITNQIIRQSVNISNSISQGLVTDFFPIHDPYVLKNIRVKPYLQVLQKLVDQKNVKVQPIQDQNPLRDMFIEYECQYTQEDFMKNSVDEKLQFKFLKATEFSVNTVAFYCGQKLAFFFEFRRFLIEKATKWTIIAFIIQILFWVETTQIYQYATSSIQTLNNVLMTILAIFNIIWVDRTIASWETRQRSLARAFGTSTLAKKSDKRVLFRGQMLRNLQTDEVNYEKVSTSHNIIKSILAFVFNVAFVVFMAATLLMIFVLKGYLYQQGYSQTTVTQVPAILISLAVVVFNFIYLFLVKIVVDFQNKRTLQEYQSSLSSKSFIVTFIVTYFVLYVYGFFSTYLSSSNICLIKTNAGVQIYNCYYYLSSQLVTTAIIDLIFTIFMAFWPYLMFRLYSYWNKKQTGKSMVSFNLNYFESIDRFYEEQDQMSTYMYTDDVDNTWMEYTKIVISFSTLILFGPIVPFLYTMMFIAGLISLHSKKYEIIYFSKRTLPVKAGSIGSWLLTIKIVSIIGVFTNLALIVYVRQVFSTNQSIIYLTTLFIILFLKYFATFLPEKQDKVGIRSKIKAQELILDRQLLVFDSSTKTINTDIENLYYDEQELKRRLPKLHKAYVKKKI